MKPGFVLINGETAKEENQTGLVFLIDYIKLMTVT